jgi:hypothetical protein
LLSEGKATGIWVDHSHQPTAEVKKESSYTSTPLSVQSVKCHEVTVNFTFTFTFT